MAEYKILEANKIKDHFHKALSNIRTGRVNASVLDSILVDAYGSKMKIVEMATVTVPEPSQLMISPFDKGLIQAIEKAIQDSNLGVNPANDGAGVRLTFPPLTEETRMLKTKEVGKLLEEARISLRNNRTDLLKTNKREKDSGEISEDDAERFQDHMQKEVDQLNKDLDDISSAKKDELMKI